jgi:microsomal dipeptidase-like Zn-dependent dipeptidase
MNTLLPTVPAITAAPCRRRLREIVDVVGVEHVCIGTDQQVTLGSLRDYSQWVQLVWAPAFAGATTLIERGSTFTSPA